MLTFQINFHFRGLKDGRLFEGWALIRGGAYLMILCLGWALIREGGLIEAFMALVAFYVAACLILVVIKTSLRVFASLLSNLNKELITSILRDQVSHFLFWYP